jgi:hypothetical protein
LKTLHTLTYRGVRYTQTTNVIQTVPTGVSGQFMGQTYPICRPLYVNSQGSIESELTYRGSHYGRQSETIRKVETGIKGRFLGQVYPILQTQLVVSATEATNVPS